MIRKGIHKPTVEDAIEISGIEILHPGGFKLTERTAEICVLSAIISEFEEWSKPEMFWKTRKDRDVKSYKNVMTIWEKVRTAYKVFKVYGLKGVFKLFENEKIFFKTILDGKLRYALFKDEKSSQY